MLFLKDRKIYAKNMQKEWMTACQKKLLRNLTEDYKREYKLKRIGSI